jgi:hypothetical protein
MGSLRQLRATESARRDADHRKDLFLATLAHKLRKPRAPHFDRRTNSRFGAAGDSAATAGSKRNPA